MKSLASVMMAGWLWLGAAGWSSADVLWRMGTRDASTAEFRPWIDPVTGARQIDYADPTSDAVYRVGEGNVSEQWPAYQPGSANGGAGFREHPARIEFGLERVPSGDLELTLDLLAYSARLPVVQVEVNGRRGWFFQHPTLTYSGGDAAVFFQPHYSESVVRCRFPGEWFKAGPNRIVLTAVDVPGDREDVRPSGFPWPGNSGLFYDALRLEETAKEGVQGVAPKVRVEPTVFHRERGGGLFAEVEVFVGWRGGEVAGRVELEMGGTVVSGELAQAGEPVRELGEARVRLEVPSWEGRRAAKVRVLRGGKSWESSHELQASRRWTLWVVPHQHLDIGYTDYDGKVAEVHSRALDDAMDMAERVPGFRYAVDGYWVIDRYLAGREPAAGERLSRAVKRGEVEVPVVHGSLFTGSASLEGLIRALYPSRRYARRHGTPFDVAIVTDVPSYSWSLASVLSAAGVRYFVGASDAYRGPFLLGNRMNELGLHEWEGPDGGRVMTWYSRHYHQVSSLFGLPPRMALGRESLPRFLQAYDRAEYRGDEVLLYGTQVENGFLNLAQADFVEVWNREYAFPRLRFGGFAEAMRSMERLRGEPVVIRGDGGPYWEDGLAANARVTALARENSRRLPSAEKLSTLASRWNPRYRPEAADLELAWEAGRLIDEHTWHADCSVRDPESDQALRQGEAKDARAYEARRAIDRLLQRGMSAMADRIPVGPGTLLAFNPLSWERGGVVEAEIGRGQVLVDSATGSPLPSDVLRDGKVYQRMRWALPEIPAMGYRSFVLRPAAGVGAARPAAEPNVLESRHYFVRLDPERGAIRSVTDRATGRELVSAKSRYALGQWLYVTGGDELPNRIVQYSTVSPIPELAIHGAGSGRVIDSRVSALGATARMESEAKNFPRIETEVFLPADRKEIRITLRVWKEASRRKEAAYVAFPWAIEHARFRYATQNGVVDPSVDILPGGCQEWYTMQDWMGVEGDGLSVVMSAPDAPLMTLGDVVRGTWPSRWSEREAMVYSYVMSNYTPEGYAASQGGEFQFRYVLTSGAGWDTGWASRVGTEAMTPLETLEVTRSDKRTAGPIREGGLESLRGSGLKVEPPSVQVSAWKEAEYGKGTIVRLVETAGRAVEARLTGLAGGLRRAVRCTAVEDDLDEVMVRDGALRVAVPAYGLVTLRVEGD